MEKYFLCLVFFTCASAWKISLHGRPAGGFLGEPITDITDSPKGKWFTQRFDHFGYDDTTTFQQRYFVNDTYYKRGGPVFLLNGGDAPISPKWMVEGTWLRYAKKYEALCIYLEHRFYGLTHPTPNLDTHNLAFLTNEQSIADMAYFIIKQTKTLELPPETKWITFGGSYAGSLSAWVRVKYPHLVHGAVSTSAPLLPVVDFKEYYAVVADALEKNTQGCVAAFQESHKQFKNLMSNSDGQQRLAKLFSLCDPINPRNADDVSNLYEILASNFASIVQYNKDNRAFEGAKGYNITIDSACRTMLDESVGSEVDRLAAVNSLLLTAYNQTCLEYKYDKMINELKETDYKSKAAEGGRQWMYQTCTEYGFFQTSTLNITQRLFGDKFPVDFFTKQCKDIFGEKVDKSRLDVGIYLQHMFYGSLNIKATNVLYVHGSTDPWHALGVTKTSISRAPAILIDGTAHCADMYPSSPDDPPQLAAARDRIEVFIGDLLKAES